MVTPRNIILGAGFAGGAVARKPSPVIDAAGLRIGHHGGIVVDGCCAVSGHSGIWALGDCAEIPQPGGKNLGITRRCEPWR